MARGGGGKRKSKKKTKTKNGKTTTLNSVVAVAVEHDGLEQQEPSPFDVFKIQTLFKIVSFLSKQEKDNLYRSQMNMISVESQQQQQQQQKADEEQGQDELDEDNNDSTMDQSTVEWTETVKVKTNGNATSRQRFMALPPELVVTDPDTLLARLNTRRLHKRLKEAIPYDDDPEEMKPYVYPTHMTTEEIAQFEWMNLLERARILASQDEEEEEENVRRLLPPSIPCDKELLLFSPCPRSVAVLASYPRSGNSLMRSMYERITLRVSGSDMRGGLVQHDLVGEAAVSEQMVQFVKTHFPERRGMPPFEASRVVLLVRNPYDALESYFNLMMTGTHTTNISDEMRIKTNEVWESMVRKEIQMWKEFHEWWLRQEIPLLLVRYEDLIRYPYEVMCRVIKFVLEIDNMDFFSNRIKRCIEQENIEKLGSYQPRSGGIGKSLQKYSPELLQEMNVGILETMETFNYTSLLIPNKDDWDLEPLDGYGREYFYDEARTVMVNQGGLVRTVQHRTNWIQLKRQINGIKQGQKCQCAKCTGKGR